MLIKTSKITLKIILAFVVLWSIANFSGYLLINHFVKNGYIKNILVNKFFIDKEQQYTFDSKIQIHWNPFSFGLDVNNLKFHDEDNFEINAKNIMVKMNIFQLMNGNFIPKKIFLNEVKFTTNDWGSFYSSLIKKKDSNPTLKIKELLKKVNLVDVKKAKLKIGDHEIAVPQLIINTGSDKLDINIIDENLNKFALLGLIDITDKGEIKLEKLRSNITIGEDTLKDSVPEIKAVNLQLKGNLSANLKDKTVFLNLTDVDSDLDTKLTGKRKIEKGTVIIEWGIGAKAAIVKNLVFYLSEKKFDTEFDLNFQKKKVQWTIRIRRD